MRTKKAAAIIIAILISAGLATASGTEFTAINSAILPASSFSLSAVAPVQAAPKININPQREFSGLVKGQNLESALFTSSLVALTALNVADYLSTRQALKSSGLQEGNPLMKPFVKNAALFAAVKGGTTALSVWGMNKMFRKGNKTTAWVLSLASNFILSYVVSNNMKLIQKAKLG